MAVEGRDEDEVVRRGDALILEEEVKDEEEDVLGVDMRRGDEDKEERGGLGTAR